MMWEALRVKLWFRMMMVNVVVCAVVTQTGDVVAAARLVGGELAKQENGVNDAAIELTTEVFNSSLWASPTTSAIVEFYAHWCPACQLFRSQYDRVAQLFNGPDAMYPGVLLMAKVDCAEEINRKLCQRFSVQRYPTMLWGKPAALAWGSRRQETDKDIEQIDSRMSAQSLLDWINNRLKTSYSLDPAMQKKQSVEVSDSVFGQMAVSIHDIEEATAEAYGIILDNKTVDNEFVVYNVEQFLSQAPISAAELVTLSHRAPFVQFLQLLAAHHPSRRCREGTARILFNVMDAWPSELILEVDEHLAEGGTEMHSKLADVASLRQLRICGEDLPSKTYKTCNMATGGYSCGLWYLFHALSIRVDDSESNAALKGICNFVANFLTCEECRQHFLKMSQNAITSVSSRHDLTLWLWRAHNEVNYRLGKGVEAESQSSKVQWPPKAICAACRTGPGSTHGNADEQIEWNEEEVYKFLRKTYGLSIVTVADEAETLGNKGDGTGHGKDENIITSATTAPIGAAVGIAMASCGFGVAACFWRVQQKRKRKWKCYQCAYRKKRSHVSHI